MPLEALRAQVCDDAASPRKTPAHEGIVTDGAMVHSQHQELDSNQTDVHIREEKNHGIRKSRHNENIRHQTSAAENQPKKPNAASRFIYKLNGG